MILRARVDVIVATNNLYIAAAKQATSTIPIVMVFGLDPVGSGFVDSFGRPGRNITGMTWDASPEIAAKQLELLREVAPSASSIAVLWSPYAVPVSTYARATETAAIRLGATLKFIELQRPQDVDGAFKSISQQ